MAKNQNTYSKNTIYNTDKTTAIINSLELRGKDQKYTFFYQKWAKKGQFTHSQ